MNAALLLLALATPGQCPGGHCPVPQARVVYAPRTPVYRPIYTAPAPPATPGPLGWHLTVRGWIYGTRVGDLVYPAG